MQKIRLLLLLFALGFAPACAAASYDRANRSTSANKAAEERFDGAEETSTSTRPLSINIFVDTGNRPLGAYSLLLTYEPERAELIDVTGPTENDFQPPFHKVLERNETAIAVIRLASYDIEKAPSGLVPVANVSFSTSEPPSRFIRNLTVETISDPDGNNIDGTATWRVQ